MKLNRSSREPGGQASNWRPPGLTGNRVTSLTVTPEVNYIEEDCETQAMLLLPSRSEKNDSNRKLNNENVVQNKVVQNKTKFQNGHFTKRRRFLTRLKSSTFSEIVLTSLVLLSTSLIVVANAVEGEFLSTFVFVVFCF